MTTTESLYVVREWTRGTIQTLTPPAPRDAAWMYCAGLQKGRERRGEPIGVVFIEEAK